MTPEQQLSAVRFNLQASASQMGVTVDELVQLLAGDQGGAGAPGAAPPGMTLAGYYEKWCKSLDLTASSRRTYRNALHPLVLGVALERRARRVNGEEVEVFKVPPADAQRWVATAKQVNRELDLGLTVPDLDAAPETVEGSPLLWSGIGHVRLVDIGTEELLQAKRWVQLRAITNGRTKANPIRTDGMGAVRGMVSALGNLYRAAAVDKHVPIGTNPSEAVNLPPRQKRVGEAKHTVEHRKTLEVAELEGVRQMWCHTGDDPELDAWLYQWHLLTGSRRSGALGLKLFLLDPEQQLVWPPDKNSDASRGVRRDEEAMPVPRALVEGLIDFARSRGATHDDDLVFRYRSGRPISARRYDTIKRRCAKLPFVAQRDRFGAHDLRSTGAARVETLAPSGRGPATKQRYLRHAANGQTEAYGRATLAELAAVISQWTGHPHPLVP